MSSLNNHRRTTNPGAPTFIEHKGMRFLIINKPSQATLPQFINELKKHKACMVVRCCDPTYDASSLVKEGIEVVDFQIADGAAPDKEIVAKWLSLIEKTFRDDSDSSIAVHCVAGLGRAPVMVAIALIEYGMKYHEAVDHIRQRRRGAINQKQLDFLERYKPVTKKDSCAIM